MPESECLAEDRARRLLVLHRARRAGLAQEMLERDDVDRDAFRVEQVSRIPRHQRAGPEELPGAGHGVVERGDSGARRFGSPQLVDESIGGEGLAGAQREQREQRTLPPLTQRHDVAVHHDGDRAQQPHLHLPLVTPETTAEKGRLEPD